MPLKAINNKASFYIGILVDLFLIDSYALARSTKAASPRALFSALLAAAACFWSSLSKKRKSASLPDLML